MWFANVQAVGGLPRVRSCPRPLITCWLVLIALSGCGGSPGDDSSAEPSAVATVIGQRFTKQASGNSAVTVRSGAEVTLTGKDSDDIDGPILRFDWKGQGSAASIPLVNRSTSTVSFRAPDVAIGATQQLTFRLTVTDSKELTDSADVVVTVIGEADPNQFILSNISAGTPTFKIVATTVQPLAPPSADVPYTVEVDKYVRYRKRSDAQEPAPATGLTLVGPLARITGAWAAGVGTDGLVATAQQSDPARAAFVSYKHPRYVLEVPLVNADEVNRLVQDQPPSSATANDEIEASDIDEAGVELAIRLRFDANASVQPASSVLVVVGNDSQFIVVGEAQTDPSTGIASLRMTSASLQAALRQMNAYVESAASARAYYAAVDPDSRKKSLDAWLRDNCFDAGVAGYGSDAHAIYVNNFDLGFGRDMHFKTTCTSAQRAATGATIDTAGGERAAVVINHPSLEAAGRKTGAFLAVAMEFRRPENSLFGNRLITSFYTFAPDTRTGQFKRVGSANFDGRGEKFTPGNCTVCHGGKPKMDYSAGPDIGAVFLPWDADSLLYSDTDPAFTDESLRPSLTRSAQAANIKALNQAVLQTHVDHVGDSAAVSARRGAMRELIQGWYANATGQFNSAFVPTSWRGQHASTNSAMTSEALYTGVFAQHCRACHMQRIEDGVVDPGTQEKQVAAVPQFNTYDEFILPPNADLIASRVFDEGVMPNARLTMDRFWVPFDGASTSPASALAQHLGLDATAAHMGRPKALATITQAGAEPGDVVRLSAAGSLYANSYDWTLTSPGNCCRLVGANTAEPALKATQSGTYSVQLKVTDVHGQQAVLPQAISFVIDGVPVAGAFEPDPVAFGTDVSINVLATPTKLGDGAHTVTLLPNSLPATISSGTIAASAITSGTVNYRITDADGDFSDGTISLAVQGQFTAPSALNEQTLANTPKVITLPIAGALPSSLPAGFTWRLRVTQQPGRQGRYDFLGTSTNGSADWVSVNATTITYTPARRFVSNQGGALLRDSFQYVIELYDSTATLFTTSTPGTVSIDVQSRRTFTQVRSGMVTNGCDGAGCHQANPTNTPPADSFWTYSTDPEIMYNQLISSSCPANNDGQGNPETNGSRCVTIGAGGVDNSYLLIKPSSALGAGAHHTGGDRYTADPGLRETIRLWLDDGAYRN
jgi:hypothetical protein